MIQNGQTNESFAFYQSTAIDVSGNWVVNCNAVVPTPQGNMSYQAFARFRLDPLLP